MRNNYAGVLGYLFLLLGLGLGGLTIVSGATDACLGTVVLAGIAVVLLMLAGLTLVLIAKREQQDPLEPIMTEEGIELYEQQREEGDV